MGPHIDTIVRKCQGLLGVLRRAAAYLPRELLHLIFISLIRPHREYCSATFVNAAPSHLKKLDVIQKIASRVITGSSSQAHSAPLQSQLGLDSLHSRRLAHVADLVDNIKEGKGHPFLRELFSQLDVHLDTTTAATKLQQRRFRTFGTAIFNDIRGSPEACSRPLDQLSWGHDVSLILRPLSTSTLSTSSSSQQTPRIGCSLLDRA